MKVGDLAGVGYQSLQWYLQSAGADLESVMRTDKARNTPADAKAAVGASKWADIDAFDKGGSAFKL